MMWPPRPPPRTFAGGKAPLASLLLRGMLRKGAGAFFGKPQRLRPAPPPSIAWPDPGSIAGGGIRRPLRPGGFPFRRTGSRIRAAPSPASLRSAAGRLPLGRRPLRPRAHGGRGTLDPPFAAPIGSPRIRRSAGDRAGTPTARGVCARRKRERADRRAALRRCVRADWPGVTLSGRVCGDIFYDALCANRS